MKINLCELFGVQEGEEFTIDHIDFHQFVYTVSKNTLWYKGAYSKDFCRSDISVNNLDGILGIIKLPKKKEFTDDELCILRNIDKTYKSIARDSDGKLFTYNKMPIKSEDINKWTGASWLDFCMYDHLFQSVKWEDEEPVRIDDYVERQGD